MQQPMTMKQLLMQLGRELLKRPLVRNGCALLIAAKRGACSLFRRLPYLTLACCMLSVCLSVCRFVLSVSLSLCPLTALHVAAQSLGACNNTVFSTLCAHLTLAMRFSASASSGVTHRPSHMTALSILDILLPLCSSLQQQLSAHRRCMSSPPRPSGSPTHGTGPLLQPLCRP